MTAIKRSTYQKVVEENKKLKEDIKTLVIVDNMEKTLAVRKKWFEYFAGEETLKRQMKFIADEYFSDKEDCPDCYGDGEITTSHEFKHCKKCNGTGKV